MENKEFVLKTIGDCEEILNNILLSGMRFYNRDIIKDNSDLINLCNSLGLQYFVDKINLINDLIIKKNHSIEFDFMTISKEYFALSAYLDIVKSKV